MNNLVPKNYFNNQPVHLQPYLIAKYSSKLIKQGEPPKVKDALTTLIIKLVYVGDDFVKKEMVNNVAIQFLREALYEECCERWPNATYLEIKSALNNGIRGEYEHITGRLYGLNISNISRWIRCYFECEKRKEALTRYMNPVRVYEPVPEETTRKGLAMLRETLNSIEKSKPQPNKKETLPLVMTAQQIEENLWLIEFDKLQKEQGTVLENGTRYVVVDGKNLTVIDFMNYKLKNK